MDDPCSTLGLDERSWFSARVSGVWEGFGAVKAMFDQISNEHNKLNKNQKNEKPAHIVFLCHILTI